MKGLGANDLPPVMLFPYFELMVDKIEIAVLLKLFFLWGKFSVRGNIFFE